MSEAEQSATMVDPAPVSSGEVATGEARGTLPDTIALIWRQHSNCNWVSTGYHVRWSCGINHPGSIHMQPTTRDRHVAALVMTQVRANFAPRPVPVVALDADTER